MIPVAPLLAPAGGTSSQPSDLPAGTRVITPGGAATASPAAPAGPAGGALSEEIWTAPHGDSMVGVWRLSRGGAVQMIEVLAIGVEQGGAVRGSLPG